MLLNSFLAPYVKVVRCGEALFAVPVGAHVEPGDHHPTRPEIPLARACRDRHFGGICVLWMRVSTGEGLQRAIILPGMKIETSWIVL